MPEGISWADFWMGIHDLQPEERKAALDEVALIEWVMTRAPITKAEVLAFAPSDLQQAIWPSLKPIEKAAILKQMGYDVKQAQTGREKVDLSAPPGETNA